MENIVGEIDLDSVKEQLKNSVKVNKYVGKDTVIASRVMGKIKMMETEAATNPKPKSNSK